MNLDGTHTDAPASSVAARSRRTLGGVHVGVVTDTGDPDQQGRVRVRFPTLSAGSDPALDLWACVALPTAGAALWADVPPAVPRPEAPDEVVTIRTRSGVVIRVSDGDDVRLELTTPEGRRIALGEPEDGLVVDDGDRSELRLDADGVHVRSDREVAVDASRVVLTAGSVHIDSEVVRATGVLQATTRGHVR